jgi:peptidoglycan/xylan/chitin deacetylase (PgdA/CDA1 family)
VATIVSLTFDDATADQAAAIPILSAHGMKGTFYVNSGHIGRPGYLTWDELEAMASEGHEIGGHTLDHVNLASVGESEANRQIHENRACLLKRGFEDRNFAYPYGAGWHDSTVRSLVQSCGYASGRGAWGLAGREGAPYTAYAETIPPQDVWAIRTARNPRSTTPLSTIQGYVTNAETNGGGWVILVFHRIGDRSDDYSTPAATFQALLEWLEPRAVSGTTIQTVAEVIG